LPLPSAGSGFADLEHHRVELMAYCYRMLGSPFDAEDAVQDAFEHAWKSRNRFGGRSAMRMWLYRIATNVCLDVLRGRRRRLRPMDLGPARDPVADNLHVLPGSTWIEPIPTDPLSSEDDPADIAVERESVRLAFVAALQRLPARQRAVLILREVVGLRASEAADVLDMSVASVNSALQRARASLTTGSVRESHRIVPLSLADRMLLNRYVSAFERYDMAALTALIREDATQSMPPFDIWLEGRAHILEWWAGPGKECRGSRLISTLSANGAPAFAQYKPSPTGGYEPWALQVLELEGGRIVEFTFFLDAARIFPLFGAPLTLS
jgi:RNA polymerase sigma-70 factor (ECF subfamily)